MNANGTEHVETVIVGGGQAGLATGYFLTRRGRPFVIVDGSQRVGDAWRTRWDSLRLFTYTRYSELPGRRLPGRRWGFPTKDDLADYLEDYARAFDMDVRLRTVVERLSAEDDRLVLTTTAGRIEADNVVVATGAYPVPRIPAFAGDLDPAILQLHSSEYHRPAQLRPGGVLLVGAGNSGADLAMEVVRDHPTWLAGRDTGHVPVRIEGIGKLGFPVFRFVNHHLFTVRTPMGRRAMRKHANKGDMLVRVKPKDLLAAGVVRVPKVAGVRDGMPVLEDGRILEEVANVIWCTGFRHDFSWIDLPILDETGMPRHERGVATDRPGVFFVGLPFQFAASSPVLPGIGRDHAYVAERIAARVTDRSARREPEPADAIR